MTRPLVLAAAAGLLIGGVVVGQSSNAAPPVVGYAGWAESSVAGCPFIRWRLSQHDNGVITGIAYYSDLSGVSTVTGTIDPEGHISLAFVSSIGQGPVAKVTGTKAQDGSVTATISGQGCANAQFHGTRVDLNDYHEGG